MSKKENMVNKIRHGLFKVDDESVKSEREEIRSMNPKNKPNIQSDGSVLVFHNDIGS